MKREVFRSTRNARLACPSRVYPKDAVRARLLAELTVLRFCSISLFYSILKMEYACCSEIKEVRR